MSRADILLHSMDEFYSDPKNAETFTHIVYPPNSKRPTDHISLRTIEKFITTFSKQTNFSYKMTDGQSFPVHVKYKSSLDGYSKKLFDPFARASKIEYTIPASGKKVVTTVAQLNFLRWAIKNGVVEFIRNNPTIMKAS